MRPLLDIRPDDSIMDVIVQLVALTFFSLLGIVMVVGLLALILLGAVAFVDWLI